MTSLDDALNSSAPIFDTPGLTIDWTQLPGENGGRENLYNVGDVLSGEYTVEHSFDDGLPDPVTMTGSNDASGKFSAGLIGRPEQVYNGWFSGSASGENAFTGTYIGTGLPSLGWGTYHLMVITIPSTTAFLTQGDYENTPYAWDFVGRQVSGTMSMWVFSKKRYTGMVAPAFYSTESLANTVWACYGVGSSDPSGNELQWRIDAMAQATAVGSATVHTQPPVASTNPRTTFLAVWSSPGVATWNAGTTDNAVLTRVSTTSAIAMANTGIYLNETRRDNIQATRSVATDDVAMMVFVLEPIERPAMSPVQFWSPFNEDSPTYGLDRDDAQLQLTFNTVTSEGVQGTVLFNGEMEDITVDPSGAVELNAVSKVRLDLNKSVSLPQVFGRREGGSIDFLIAWIAARGDKFIGSAPGPYARWWVPCYGSLHAGLDAPYGYNYGIVWTSGGGYGMRYPEFVEGRYHTAAFASHTSTEVRELVMTAPELYRSKEIWPWVRDNFFEAQYLQDMMSFRNRTGRFSFWIRGDAAFAGTPTGTPSGNRFLASFLISSNTVTGSTLGEVAFFIEPTDRAVYVRMGNTAGGTTTLTFPSLTIPTDGDWHFCAISWDFAAGSARVMVDGVSGSSTAWLTNGNVPLTGWPNTDADLYTQGGRINVSARFHLPVSDVVMEAGAPVHTTWTDLYPVAPWPSFTMLTRPTNQTIEAVVDDTPVNAWDTLAELARNTRSMYRANEWDELEFFPPSYFGEPAQQAVDYVTDTEVNAQDLAITSDPSKSRNVVTVKYPDTLVDEIPLWALQLTSAYEIPPGTNDIIFTLDDPVAEIHGAADPYGADWQIILVTTYNPGFVPPTRSHWMTLNSLPDGNGTIITGATATARIVGNTQTTVTIRFTNKLGASIYLANNYEGDDEMPFLFIYGYVTRTSDAYTTAMDGKPRRERAMDSEMDWIQDRLTAQQMAGGLIAELSRPRPEVVVEVMADPRRIPGQLVTLADAATTRASGNWRVLGISHNADGPAVSQTLRLTRVKPVGMWDVSRWDEFVWGE